MPRICSREIKCMCDTFSERRPEENLSLQELFPPSLQSSSSVTGTGAALQRGAVWASLSDLSFSKGMCLLLMLFYQLVDYFGNQEHFINNKFLLSQRSLDGQNPRALPSTGAVTTSFKKSLTLHETKIQGINIGEKRNSRSCYKQFITKYFPLSNLLMLQWTGIQSGFLI